MFVVLRILMQNAGHVFYARKCPFQNAKKHDKQL